MRLGGSPKLTEINFEKGKRKMPNTKLYFAEAVLFDGDRPMRVVTTDESKAMQMLHDAFVDKYGPISAYGYESWDDWDGDTWAGVREVRLDSVWEEY